MRGTSELLLHHLPTQIPKLSVGFPVLDRLLLGGIPCNSITEFLAESATGKIQICLQLLLTAQLSASSGSLSASLLYPHSEFPFSLRRLKLMSLNSHLPHNHLDRIFVHPLHSIDSLLDLLPRLGSILPRLNIKLIVIDSIAALFRGEFENTPIELKRRLGILFKISSTLRLFSQKYGLAIVLTNQVVDVIGTSQCLRTGNSGILLSSGRRVSATLGLSWVNCVNTRLFLWIDVEIVGEEGESTIRKRFIRVVFAPYLPDFSCEFSIR